MRFRVATFNIHHGVGRDGRLDIERTASVIRSLECDVVALQELDRGATRSGAIDQPGTLAKLTGLEVEFHPTVSLSPGDYGIALASKHPLETSFVPLPRWRDEEPRGAIVGSGSDVTVVGTHLSRDRRARALQVATLRDLAEGVGRRAVLMGDLNEGVKRLAPLADAGLGRCQPRGLFRAPFRAAIDHVFVGSGLECFRAWFVRTDASDHYPLVAELQTR